MATSVEDCLEIIRLTQETGLKYMMMETSSFRADCFAMRQIGQQVVDVLRADIAAAEADHSLATAQLDVTASTVYAVKSFTDDPVHPGDTVTLDLAPGQRSYEVQGLHRSRSRDFYIPRDVLAADLGADGCGKSETHGP